MKYKRFGNKFVARGYYVDVSKASGQPKKFKWRINISTPLHSRTMFAKTKLGAIRIAKRFAK